MVEWFMGLPSLVKIGCSFAAILVIYRSGAGLGVAIIASTVLLNVWAGAGLPGLLSLLSGFRHPDNILLVVVMLLLLYFTETLGRTGRIDSTIKRLAGYFGHSRWLFAGLPALIGLLPMPGGALVSAPLVQSVDADGNAGGAGKAAVNYWYRHIWEYWWPLYPGVILAIQYSRLPTAVFIVIQLPLTIAAIAAGGLILRELPKRRRGEAVDVKSVSDGVGGALVPIGILVSISVGGALFFSSRERAGASASLVAMLVGLICSLVPVLLRGRHVALPVLRQMISVKTGALVTVVIGIQLFSAVLKFPLDSHGATLVSTLRDELFAFGIPLAAVIVLIPFLSGIVTGIAMGFVGASFPLVFGLIGQDPAFNVLAATVTCAFAFGYMGMMLSPVHICLVVTCEYFDTGLFAVYRYLWKPVLVVLGVSAVMTCIYFNML